VNEIIKNPPDRNPGVAGEPVGPTTGDDYRGKYMDFKNNNKTRNVRASLKRLTPTPLRQAERGFIARNKSGHPLTPPLHKKWRGGRGVRRET